MPGTPSADLPVEIADSETIARAIISPHHVRGNGQPRAAAFRPKAGESAISVIRQMMGDDFCKDKGVEIGALSKNGAYVGLLVLLSASIRAHSSEVRDSRNQYFGHADLDHCFNTASD